MILYTEKNEKIHCFKSKQPKYGKSYWDSFIVTIDEIEVKFSFNMKNNRAYFHFYYNSQWYKTPMINDDLDLWYKFDNERKSLLKTSNIK